MEVYSIKYLIAYIIMKIARIKTIAKFISNNLNSVKSDKSTQLANNNFQIKLFSGVKLVPLDLSKYDLKRLG